MKGVKKNLFFLLLCFFVGSLSVSAKEVNFYFYPNGGNVTTKDFEKSSYGYITYNNQSYSEYSGSTTIKHINSINGKTFKVTKSGTSLVKGREWYFKSSYDGNIYFLSEDGSYKIDDIFSAMGEPGTFSSISLYAHWSDNTKTGKDIKTNGTAPQTPVTTPTTVAKKLTISSPRTSITVGDNVVLTSKFKPSGYTEKITWSSSNSNIASVDSSGKVKGLKTGKVTITGKSVSGLKDSVTIRVTKVAEKNHYVQIIYNTNGGSLSSAHGSAVTLDGNKILCDGSPYCTKVIGTETLPSYGLRNFNFPSYINITRDGYYIDRAEAWNTKANGHGKSYSQSKIYKASDFCDATKKDCTVTLYANWKKAKKVYKVALIGNSKTRFGSKKYPKSNVSEAFKAIASSMGKSVDVTLIVRGGSTLVYKAENDPYKKKIKSEKFDYVVLQEQTDVAANDGNKFKTGALEIYNLLKNKNATIFVRTSWPRNDNSFNNNVALMDSNAQAVASAVNGSVIYDGRAFQTARESGFNTHVPDNNHPSTEGTYIAAACIYKHIFNESATDITYYYGMKKDKATKLLEIAESKC